MTSSIEFQHVDAPLLADQQKIIYICFSRALDEF